MHIAILMLFLPILGLVLFLVLPFSQALPAYLIVLAFSIFIAVLVIRTLRRSRRTNLFTMVGQPAEVISWKNGKGQVQCQGEIWTARSETGESFGRGDKVKVAELRGMTLLVKRAEG